jgi:inner membrane protein
MKRAVSAPLRFLPERIGESGRRAEIKLRLGLNGARSIRFLPSGESTTVQLSGDWPSPSFSGYRLPNERNVEAAGFSASWYSGDASRPYPAAFQALSADPSGAGEGLFGMDFLMPADVYQQTHRALRYAILFIIIPFAALFLFEALLKKRIHPLQYALIGLADSMFYLLLLSLAEHMPFMAAYCVAAAAVTALVTVYAASILGGRKGAFVILPILLAQYAYLMCALQSEDYALVIGSVGLFAIVSCVMVATRKIDWYSGRRRLPPIMEG